MSEQEHRGGAASRRQPFRPDIQGLRALAVGLVVLYHAHLPGLPGGYVGVDVFFVISGFLITNHLVSSIERGTFGFASFYARRALRILPAGFVVLVASAAAGFVLLPPLQQVAITRGAIATALYVPNLFFAATGTDYLAEGAPSLFQHYWSLGVEEQFYLVWPLLLVAAVRRSRRALVGTIALLVVLSFLAGLVLVERSQPWAFFSLPTRAWELGVGALVALAAPHADRIGRLAGTFAWAGLAGILAGAILFTEATTFPGVAALLPVLGTALVLLAGAGGRRTSAARVLSRKPLLFVGGISYSLYLVHWPLQVIPAQAPGTGEPLPLWLTLSLAAVAVPLAYLLRRFVELPAQRMPAAAPAGSARLLGVAAACSLLIAASVGVAGSALSGQPVHAASSAADAPTTTRATTFTSFVPSNLTPALRDAAADTPPMYEQGCNAGYAQTEPLGCTFGENADAPLVALFGDSHAAQWSPALTALAEEGVVRVRLDTKSSCPSVDVVRDREGTRYIACEQWRDNVTAALLTERPDLVLLSNYSTGSAVGASDWTEGLARTVDAFGDAGIRTVVLADSPALTTNPATCLSVRVEQAQTCGAPIDTAIDQPLLAAEKTVVLRAGGEYVSLNDLICSPTFCGAIRGNVLIYRDTHHLTATFARSLADPLSEVLGVAP